MIDAESHEVLEKIGFAIPGVPPELIQPLGVDFSKDGKLVFVALGPSNRVAVIDAATYEVKDYILVGQRPWHLELSPDGSKLYVANGLTNDMTVIDDNTILFRDGRTVYVNHPLGGCNNLHQSGRALVTQNFGPQLCRGDQATVAEL